MKKTLALIIALQAAACATATPPPEVERTADRMPTWIGQAIDDRIARNGPPNTQWDLPDGRRAYQWERSVVVTNAAIQGWQGAAIGRTAAGRLVCYYTLYTRKSEDGFWRIVGFEPPRPGCP